MIISILQAFRKHKIHTPGISEAKMILFHWNTKNMIFIPEHRRMRFGIKGEI